MGAHELLHRPRPTERRRSSFASATRSAAYLFNLDQQVVLEVAIGARCQLPLNHAMIRRADAMYGLIEGSGDDVAGVRVEFRWKF